MKRSIRLLLASAVVATVGMIAPSPASAGTDVCAGVGTATLPQIGLPGVHTITTGGFTFAMNLVGPTCVPSGSTSLAAGGTMNGWCGLSSGHGTASVHGMSHRFAYNSQGTVITLTGEVNGVVDAVEDPQDTPSCTNRTAQRFIITGEATFTHHNPCTLTSTPVNQQGVTYTSYTYRCSTP